MEIVGYADRLRAQPGETIGFKVSCRAPGFSAQLVRLIHTDRNPGGPGFKQELVDSPANASYPGRVQKIRPGSYVAVPHHPALNLEGGFTIAAWICPTAPGRGTQAVLTKWRGGDSAGYGLLLDEEGCLAVWIGDGRDNHEEISTGERLRPGAWYFTAVSYEPETGETTLRHSPAAGSGETGGAAVGGPAYLRPAVNESPLLIGACRERTIARHFNGKIDNPKVYDRALSAAEINDLFAGRAPDRGLTAAWDFGRDFAGSAVTDLSPNGLHGTAVNLPARAVTGHNWSGEEDDFQRAPDQYAALHFQDDDLEDASWETDFEYTIPEDLRSGAYSFRLRAGTDEDHIPFLVRPPTGSPASRIALLFNTYTLLAYGARRPGDGTGPRYASARRPLLNFRPATRFGAAGDGEGGRWDAGLRLADWLEEAGHEFDIITDEDLHEEGSGLLAPYRAVMSVPQPEFWTGNMLDGLEAYLEGGGRFMYLGGAGLSRVASVDPHRPHIIEIRGRAGAGPGEAPPGEAFHGATGERGGMWRDRGRAPERLVGIGSTAETGDGARSAYRRTEDGRGPQADFIFAGVTGGTFGDFAAPGWGRGAAGGQVERMDGEPDGPRRALRVAVAADFKNADGAGVGDGGSGEPVRADMVYLQYPGGGAVFAAGSSAWSACLSYNNYDNDISKITDNVLRRFASDDPLPA